MKTSDKIQVVAIIINVVLVVAVGYWNYLQEDRLSKLEYDEFAPKIKIYRSVDLDLKLDFALYNWIVRNNGRTSAEDVTISIFSNEEFKFGECNLAVPFDTAKKRLAGNYILFENISLPPQGTINIFCVTKHGSLLSFLEKYKVFPDKIPCLNCEPPADFDIAYLLPNLGITGKNLETARVQCVQDQSEVFK